LEQIYATALAAEDLDPNTIDRESLKAELQDDAIKAYDEREEELGAEIMRQIERYILLQIIDDRWREHLHDMDYLREGIHLRGFAQIDPLVAYKNEGFEMFTALIGAIWEEFARYIYHVEVEYEGAGGNGFQPQAAAGARGLQYGGGGEQPSALAAAAAAGVPPAGLEYAEEEMLDMPVHVETRHVDEKGQRGCKHPCVCASGSRCK